MDATQTAEMAKLIDQRRDVLAHILKASLDQEAAINEGLVERLVARLNDKQTLIDRLHELQLALAPYAEVAAEARVWVSEQERERVRSVLAETTRIQQAILEIDARCERAMTERRDELFTELNTTNGAIEAARAYDQAPVGGTRRPRGRGLSLDVTIQ